MFNNCSILEIFVTLTTCLSSKILNEKTIRKISAPVQDLKQTSAKLSKKKQEWQQRHIICFKSIRKKKFVFATSDDQSEIFVSTNSVRARRVVFLREKHRFHFQNLTFTRFSENHVRYFDMMEVKSSSTR